MKVHTVFILICLSLTAPSASAQSNGPASAMAASPAVPEEARRHFVMGTTLFKEAKAADDFSQVESEFKKAGHPMLSSNCSPVVPHGFVRAVSYL
jgi:hypothetical protein